MTQRPSEHDEQVLFVQWFRRSFKGVLIFAIPNGGKRGVREAARLKSEGVTRGIPDLCVPDWRLYIEMKRGKGGRLSPEQIAVKEYLEGAGYTVLVCHGFDDAVAQVKKFLDGRNEGSSMA